MDFDDIMESYEYTLPKRKRRNKVLPVYGATVPIKNAKVIPTNPRVLAQMDSESIKKSAEQQRDEVGVMGYAREMIAGPCDDEKGKTLIKKL